MYDKHTTLHIIFSRMCLEAGIPPEHCPEKRERFVKYLFKYPEDLICAAYCHITHHSDAHVPTEAEFIGFMQPEYRRRLEAA